MHCLTSMLSLHRCDRPAQRVTLNLPHEDGVRLTLVDGHGDPGIDVSSYDVTLRLDPGRPDLSGTAALVLTNAVRSSCRMTKAS